jgi:hypothetical protein
MHEESEQRGRSRHEIDRLIRRLTRDHIEAALRRLQSGESTPFANSTTYDVEYGSSKFPPKRVIGLALEELTGEKFGPYDFIGGVFSASFRRLQELQFRIVDKHGQPRRSYRRKLNSPGQTESMRSPRGESNFRIDFEDAERDAVDAGAFDIANLFDARRKVLAAIVRRQGQPEFRRNLFAAYGGQCAITGCQEPATLEAAHISPYLGPKTNHVQNGLLLRADIHTLFDLRLLRIDPSTLCVQLARGIAEHYRDLQGRRIRLPKNKDDWPSLTALTEHGSPAEPLDYRLGKARIPNS